MKCHVCGNEYHSHSLGGPGICPSCDCGHPPKRNEPTEYFAKPAAPQRGEVGEEARAWLKNAIQHAQFWGSPIVANHLETIEAALSRPPVVRAMTAKENDLIEWMLKINEFNGAPIMWLSRLEHLASEVAAERALAVTPESEAG